MRRTVGPWVVWLLAVAVACSTSNGSPSLCEQMSKCGAAPLTVDMIAKCNRDLQDTACGADYRAYLQCRATNEVCLAEGGRDETATFAACGDALTTWNDCTSPAPDAGGDMQDSSTNEVDTGAEPDAGPGAPDSGTNPPDASADASDSGTNPPDASADASDSGTNPPDASADARDSGTNPPDASADARDSGAGRPDAGGD